jgi:hypothetical protein
VSVVLRNLAKAALATGNKSLAAWVLGRAGGDPSAREIAGAALGGSSPPPSYTPALKFNDKRNSQYAALLGL